MATIASNYARHAANMRNAWQADMAYRPTIDLNALDAKLRKLCENKADYLAKRRTIWSAVPVLSHDTTEIARLYQAHISAIKQINKRRGHDRARQIARERDLLRERDWFDAMFGL